MLLLIVPVCATMCLEKLINLNRAVFFCRGENNLGFGASVFLNVSNELVEIFGRIKGYLYVHCKMTRNAAAFEHVGVGANKGIKFGLLVGAKFQINKSNNGETEFFKVHAGMVAGDDSLAFKALNSGMPTINISDCPDLAPILMSVAAVKNGVHLTGTARLKIKESDRGEVMARELSKFGVPVTVNGDDITVEGGCFRAPTEPLYGHNDHRVVMSMAVLCTLTGGEIIGAQACRKSYPDFFEVIKKLGIEVFESGN